MHYLPPLAINYALSTPPPHQPCTSYHNGHNPLATSHALAINMLAPALGQPPLPAWPNWPVLVRVASAMSGGGRRVSWSQGVRSYLGVPGAEVLQPGWIVPETG